MSLMRIKTYSELQNLSTFEERYDYLKLDGSVGSTTFGYDRYLNQTFYTSTQWKQVRTHVIARDSATDLGVRGHDIFDRVIVHHMNPMTVEDFVEDRYSRLNPEFLICTTHDTHNAIHYGDRSLLRQPFVERRPGDTKLW